MKQNEKMREAMIRRAQQQRMVQASQETPTVIMKFDWMQFAFLLSVLALVAKDSETYGFWLMIAVVILMFRLIPAVTFESIKLYAQRKGKKDERPGGRTQGTPGKAGQRAPEHREMPGEVARPAEPDKSPGHAGQNTGQSKPDASDA